MLTIFRYTLRRFWGQILGWGIALALLAALIVGMYDSIADQQAQFEVLLESYPPELMAFFGADDFATSLFTPEGFISVELFSWMPIVIGIFAVLMGSGLLVGDEEKGTLDLILAHPVSRTQHSAFHGALAGLCQRYAGHPGHPLAGLCGDDELVYKHEHWLGHNVAATHIAAGRVAHLWLAGAAAEHAAPLATDGGFCGRAPDGGELLYHFAGQYK